MKKRKNFDKRLRIQLFAAVLANGYLLGFFKGKIFTGNTKQLCVPVLNCYSCPGALGACPIGAMQAVLGGRKHNFTFYAVGMVILFGVLLGRLVCGFLCPFGLIQDLLYKLPVPKVKIAKKIDKPLRWTKYVIAAVMVIILPIVLTNDFGIAPPYFCQWLCPVGTLEGGIPLILTNKSLRASLGFLFNWKMAILLVVVGGAMFVYRPFCKYFCPLGAFYSLFNKISFYKMNVDKLKCNGCRVCEQSCKMNIEITKSIDSLECIRCGECKKVCKQGAITSGFPFASMCSDTEIKGEERSG